MKAYYLVRKEDVSQTSGTGRIAEVAEFDDGTVAVRWIASMNETRVPSTTIFNSLDDMRKVHGHQGRTDVEPIREDNTRRPLEERLRAALELLERNGIPAPE